MIRYIPTNLRNRLKQSYYHYLIKRDKFESEEPEYDFIDSIITSGDWVIDIGANIGTYTAKFSKLAGVEGRVIAIEPYPETFAILAENAKHFRHQNITLINVAASDIHGKIRMNAPISATGQKIHWQAHIISDQSLDKGVNVLCLPIDSLNISANVKAIKVDVEGHEYNVIMGMINLIKRDRPLLIIEDNSSDIDKILSDIGYTIQRLPESPNKIFSFPLLTQ